MTKIRIVGDSPIICHCWSAKAQREILEKDGDVELAKAFVKKVNAELEAEGIKRIHVDFAAEAAGK